MLKVVKFGGTSVGDGARIAKAAASIAKDLRRGNQIVVVVSAMGGSTDTLLKTSADAAPKASREELDEILAMGELTSIRLFKAALANQGCKAVIVDHKDENWPIITDSNFGNAKPILDECKRLSKSGILKLLKEGNVVIMPGFVGKDKKGRTTTIGRGGGDTTAALIGNCLDADEVAIVTDVDGVMSADPRIIKDAQLINRIGIEELWDLAVMGANVMHYNALRYIKNGTRVKIVNNKNEDIMISGTEIIGELTEGIRVDADKSRKSTVTVVGHRMNERAGLLKLFSGALADAGITIYSVSASTYSISFVIDEGKEKIGLNVLHEIVKRNDGLRAVTSKTGVGILTIAGKGLSDTPGVVGKIGDGLSKAGINILGFNTSVSEANILLAWSDMEKGKRVLENLKW